MTADLGNNLKRKFDKVGIKSSSRNMHLSPRSWDWWYHRFSWSAISAN